MSKSIHEEIHGAMAAVGDHLGAQHADPDKRVVPGHGVVGARTVVARHSNKPSCGTEGPTLAEVSARGATNASVKVGG